jgi:hypothetical protein
MQKKKGGFNAPLPVAPGFKPQLPQELSAPQVGPTLANEAQLPVEQRTQDGTMIGVPDFNEPYIVPEAAQAFGDVPVNMPSNPLDPNAQISAVQDRLPSAPSEVDSRGFLEKFADATRSDPAPQVGGGLSPFGGGTAMRTKAEGASGGVVDAIQSAIPMGLPGALPFEGTPSPATPAVVSDDPFGVTPEEIAAAGNENFGKAVAENPYRSQYGVNSLEQGAVDEIQQQDTAAPQAQLPSTIQNAGGQNLAGFKPKYEGQSLTDYMAGRDDPSAASVQVQDPQGRFRRQAASVAGETPGQNQSRTDALFPEQADFEQASADREARQAARPDFGEAQERAAGTITDAERRGNGAPTALFKEEAEAAGLSGRAKSDFISEKTRLWSEAKEDREIDQASGQAAGERANLEMGLKIKDWEKTNDDERKERVDEMNTEIGALTSIIGQAENISGVAQEAGRQVGAGTTGFFSPLKFIGGTTAADLAGNLETIKSDAFVANITEMRKNSPTGGAVGNVSDKDLEMLQSLQTSFRQNLKPTTLRANLKKYQKIRAKVVTDAKKGFVLKYGQENLNKYFGDQQQTAGKGSSAIPNDRNVTTSNNELYEKHSQ